MNLTRRSALFGLLAAPAIIRAPGLLMPVRASKRPSLLWADKQEFGAFRYEPISEATASKYPIYFALHTSDGAELSPTQSMWTEVEQPVWLGRRSGWPE